jgi:hypothetical protein
MSCSACQPKGSRRGLWFVIVVLVVAGIIALVEPGSRPQPLHDFWQGAD